MDQRTRKKYLQATRVMLHLLEGHHSRLPEGKTLQDAVQSLGHVAEGVYSARTVLQRALHLGVDMPITECVVALLDGELKPDEAVAALMGRDPKGELL